MLITRCPEKDLNGSGQIHELRSTGSNFEPSILERQCHILLRYRIAGINIDTWFLLNPGVDQEILRVRGISIAGDQKSV